MTQLVKCFDYVSRYETHLSRYVNQFLRIKGKKWEAFKEKEPVKAMKNPEPFYKEMFRHQLTWASSTPLRKSDGSPLNKDQKLRQLLQWFDDTALLFYHPVLKLEGAEADLDLILVTPFTVWVIVYLQGEKGSVFQGQTRRQWKEVRSEDIRTLVNPLISLARSTELVIRCLEKHGDHMSVKPVLLVPESFVEFADPGRGVQIVDQSLFPSWLKSIESYRSPIKRQQLKVADHLLKQSVTHAEIR